ncbi:MAG: (Fe-S)-binding protein [Syntrophobacteraceae bacterium CG2_30_61_12]|nr:MAG: (Fe-S)-binding protein [Syntrophobacteraceae bacterium CG2_30_61_12]
MADVRDLARMLRELQDQLGVCMRCGMCQSVCPLYGETGREADVARGKLALLDGLARELFHDPAGVEERMHRCLLCGSCAANCPSGVRVLDIFIKARAILTGYQGLPVAKRLVLRGFLGRPRLFDRVLEWGARAQDWIIRPADETLGTSCARFSFPFAAGRHLKALAERPFHQMVPAVDTAAGASGLKVAVFVGCLIDKIFPEIGRATLKVLDHHGVAVFLPENQACCGIPAVSAGDNTTFRKLVRHNLERFEEGSFDYLVTACATCTATIKQVWPMLFAGEKDRERRRVRALAEKTLDIHQFLCRHVILPEVPRTRDGNQEVVTYHDPCHLKKSLGAAAEPRRLIALNRHWMLKEMAQPDWCCGLGGSFNLEHYELSSGIGRRKRDQVAATGCTVVATGCPACMLQLHDMLSRAHDRIRVKHAIELYAESLDEA